jgi:hypothetical protein
MFLDWNDNKFFVKHQIKKKKNMLPTWFADVGVSKNCYPEAFGEFAFAPHGAGAETTASTTN